MAQKTKKEETKNQIRVAQIKRSGW